MLIATYTKGWRDYLPVFRHNSKTPCTIQITAAPHYTPIPTQAYVEVSNLLDCPVGGVLAFIREHHLNCIFLLLEEREQHTRCQPVQSGCHKVIDRERIYMSIGIRNVLNIQHQPQPCPSPSTSPMQGSVRVICFIATFLRCFFVFSSSPSNRAPTTYLSIDSCLPLMLSVALMVNCPCTAIAFL